MKADVVIEKMKAKGITEETLQTISYSGIDVSKWLHGFTSVNESVAHSVDIVKKHPLMPKDIPVHGLVIDPQTGKLDLVVNGYKD